MKTHTHTPGPWYLNPNGWVVQSTGEIVTRLECSNNKERDARLIASAPDLFEALKELANLNTFTATRSEQDLAYSKARAAISKAEGRA